MDEFKKILDRGTYDNEEVIDLSSEDYIGGAKGFFIDVGVSGTLRWETFGGQIVEKTIAAGPHPVRLKRVYYQLDDTSSGTAASISAMW